MRLEDPFTLVMPEHIAAIENDEDAHALWRRAIARERFRWRTGEPCRICGEWIGHYGGDLERDPCSCIPQDVPLEEVRPNRYCVLRHWIGEAIRHACKD
jgi:hypothetical protein